MAVVNVLLSIILILACLFMIATVLLQSSNAKGLGAVAGQMETYFSKNKAKTIDAKLAKYTKWVGAAFVILTLVIICMVAAGMAA